MAEPKARDERTRDLLAKLDQGLAGLKTSDQWRAWLDDQAKFHRYSFNNVLLIVSQRPDASMVAAFHAWKDHGRMVNKGERAIWILAPMVVKAKETDPETGEQTERPRVVGFKSVPVFDVAQTSGAEVPVPAHPLAGRCAEEQRAALTAYAQSLGFTVDPAADLPMGRNGDTSHSLRRIRISRSLPGAQWIKTTAHEIGHAILHGPEYDGDRGTAEVEAESVAYLVCQQLGIDSAEYSFGYITVWAGKDPEAARAAVRKAGGRIAKTAETITKALDQAPAHELVAA
ncbi:MAG: ArdC-like ssDNA-binding domain-containing protein [Candidatus Dormibacteria bacterium]